MIKGYIALIVVLGLFSSAVGGMLSEPQAADPDTPTLRIDQRPQPAEPRSFRTSQTKEASDGSVQLDRESDGHFYADVRINGATVRTLIDTGASGIALSREDARKAGLATSIGMHEVVGKGADGDVHGEFVTLDDVSLGGKSAAGMSALVLNAGEQSLLGQSFLSKFESVVIRGDTMVLR